MPRLNNNGNIIEYATEAEFRAAIEAISPNLPQPLTVEIRNQTTGGETIDVSNFPIPDNCFGSTEIKVKIIDVVSGDFGIGHFIVRWRRFGGTAPTIISTTQFIALQTPGTLAGAAAANVVVGNNIIGRFTGVSGRTINIYARYDPDFVRL